MAPWAVELLESGIAAYGAQRKAPGIIGADRDR